MNPCYTTTPKSHGTIPALLSAKSSPASVASQTIPPGKVTVGPAGDSSVNSPDFLLENFLSQTTRSTSEVPAFTGFPLSSTPLTCEENRRAIPPQIVFKGFPFGSPKPIH
ncbi:MAG: hypothetical protein CK425_04505 [Parachlamydia sp.]|nr:MAG: hypothetical protein CK425_04505 [Parachlamydia sp.]